MIKEGFNSDRVLRYFKGKASDEDTSYIEHLFLNSDNEKELKHFLLRQLYDLPKEDGDKKDLSHILYRIHYEINTNKSHDGVKKISRFLKWVTRIAAIIIFPLATIWGVRGYLNSNSIKETWFEINAPAWTRAKFSLPDGTIGWLNSNSSIRYSGNFLSDRQITLKGEAFFDVYHDKEKPFVVNTNEVNIKVLGTRFNIASYDNENNIEVVLLEGKLLFTEEVMNKSYLMNPNDLVKYEKSKKTFYTEVVEPKIYSSWTEGKLVFRNDPVDVIFRRLGRYYNVDVELQGKINGDPRLRATFPDDKLEEVLELLKLSLPIDYRIEDRSIGPDETFIKKKVVITLLPNKP